MTQTTVLEDILAIQAADNQPNEAIENIDIPSIHRGAASGMDMSYLDIAKKIGMGDNKYPESNVKDLFHRSLTKMIQHYIFMLISDAAMKHGFSEEDAIDFTSQSYRHDKSIGKSDVEILRGWM